MGTVVKSARKNSGHRKIKDEMRGAGLMDLPVELRVAIYEEVMPTNEWVPATNPFPAITKVCSKMRAEALHHYLHYNRLYMALPIGFNETHDSPEEDARLLQYQRWRSWKQVLEGWGVHFESQRIKNHLKINGNRGSRGDDCPWRFEIIASFGKVPHIKVWPTPEDLPMEILKMAMPGVRLMRGSCSAKLKGVEQMERTIKCFLQFPWAPPIDWFKTERKHIF